MSEVVVADLENPEIETPKWKEYLSVEEFKTLIRSEFDLRVPKDDPIFMLVHLNNLLIDEHVKQYHAHEKRLGAIVNEAAVQCVHAVNESISLLQDEALKGSLENTLLEAQEHASGTERSNNALLQKIKRYSFSFAAFSALNWAAVIALYFIIK